MTNLHDHPWPGPLVVGGCSTGGLAFLPEAYAVGAAAELDRWRATSTWGRARELATAAEHVPPPIHLEDLEAEQDGDAPFVLTDLGIVADGEWPPIPAALSLELVQRHWSVKAPFRAGSAADTVHNGPYLEVDPADQAALVAELERAGCTVRVDHDLLRRAGEA